MDKELRAREARAVLDNPVVKDVFKAIETSIDNSISACNPDDQDQAQRCVIAKQIYLSIQREFIRIIQTGNLEKVKIASLEKKRLFRR